MQRIFQSNKTKSKERLTDIIRNNWQLYVLLLPGLIYVFIFNYMPMYGVQIAFKDYSTRLGIWGSHWVGLAHFKRFIEYPLFSKIVWNTMRLSLYSIATFPCSVIFALMLDELNNQKYKRAVQMVSYAPHFISTVVLCGMIRIFFARSNGLINNIIAFLGGARYDFLSDPSYFGHIYVWSGVWQNIGWGTIIYLAALSSVGSDMREAAIIDGANRMHIIWYINIPTILPTIMIMLIMNCGNVLSVGFEKVYLLQNNLNLDASQVISTYVYEVGIGGAQFSYSSAIGLFNTVVNIVILIIVNKISKMTTEIGIW